MDCPQCGAVVPSDDEFCGKCGYAKREHAPERLDQSRIRVHEGPEPGAEPAQGRASSQQRIRKHTVMGMPSATPPGGSPAVPPPEPAAPPAPSPITAGRSARARSRTPQKTMMGIPRPDFVKPPGPDADTGAEAGADTDTAVDTDAGADAVFTRPQEAAPSHRARARVRYDSANEPLPVIQRRQRALRGLALLALLAAVWLGYRFLTLNG